VEHKRKIGSGQERRRAPQRQQERGQAADDAMPTTVVIADDHAFTVAGISSALTEMAGFNVVGVAHNGIEAIMLIKKHCPDCAVLDLTMPGANGLEVFIEARRWSPRTRTAIITGNPSPAIFAQLVEAGVDGIFLKNSAPEDICAGIRDMTRGKRVVAPEIMTAIKASRGTAGLTAREIEVLHGIARGLSNLQIADALGVSPKTVDSHRTTLMRKMGVHSTATLLVRALRDGLIDI
jgi:DNA-binding NarL/FixJ family response regulator